MTELQRHHHLISKTVPAALALLGAESRKAVTHQLLGLSSSNYWYHLTSLLVEWLLIQVMSPIWKETDSDRLIEVELDSLILDP